MTTPTLHEIDLASLMPSPTNPRRAFPAESLADLSASIRANGILSPIVARPMPEKYRAQAEGRDLEIVFGERRYRAAQEAGLTTAPVIVRSMTDEEVLTAQVVENLQREGVTPLEEAHGYRAMRAAGMNLQQISDAVGVTRQTIYNALKLLALQPEVAAMLGAGTIEKSLAMELARLPASLQLTAAKYVTEQTDDGERPSTRAAIGMLRQKYCINLPRSVFDYNTACEGCESRTGARLDICTNAECHAQKTTDHHAASLAEWADCPRITVKHAGAIPNWTELDTAGLAALSSICYSDPEKRSWAEVLPLTPDDVALVANNNGTFTPVIQLDEARAKIKIALAKAAAESAQSHTPPPEWAECPYVQAPHAGDTPTTEELEAAGLTAIRVNFRDTGPGRAWVDVPALTQEPILITTDFVQLVKNNNGTLTHVVNLAQLRTLRAPFENPALYCAEHPLPEPTPESTPAPTPKTTPAPKAPTPAPTPAAADEIRYRNPMAPHLTWTGKGKAPQWATEARAAGLDIECPLYRNAQQYSAYKSALADAINRQQLESITGPLLHLVAHALTSTPTEIGYIDDGAAIHAILGALSQRAQAQPVRFQEALAAATGIDTARIKGLHIPTPEGYAAPNENGVFENPQKNKLTIPEARFTATLMYVNTPKGWRASIDYTHKDEGHYGLPSLRSKTYDTQEEAIRAAFREHIHARGVADKLKGNPRRKFAHWEKSLTNETE